MTLHVRDRRGAASLRYRNRTATTVLMCKQNPIRRYGFRAGAKAIRYCLNIALVDSGKGHVNSLIHSFLKTSFKNLLSRVYITL